MNVQKNNAGKFTANQLLRSPKLPCESDSVKTITSKDLLTILTRATTTINTTADKIKGVVRGNTSAYSFKDDDDSYPKIDTRDEAFAVFVDSFNAVRKFAAHDAKSRGETYTQGQFQGVPKGYEKKLADDIIKVMFLGATFNLAVAEAVIAKLCYSAVAEDERKRA